MKLPKPPLSNYPRRGDLENGRATQLNRENQLAACYVLIERSHNERLLQTAFYYLLIGVGVFVIWAGVWIGIFFILLVLIYSYFVNCASSRILAHLFGWSRSERLAFSLQHTVAEFRFRGQQFLQPTLKRCKEELLLLIDGDVEDFLNREREWRR